MIPVDAKVLGRLISAWKDPNITNRDLRRRFKLSDADMLELRLRWERRPQLRMTPQGALGRAIARARAS